MNLVDLRQHEDTKKPQDDIIFQSPKSEKSQNSIPCTKIDLTSLMQDKTAVASAGGTDAFSVTFWRQWRTCYAENGGDPKTEVANFFRASMKTPFIRSTLSISEVKPKFKVTFHCLKLRTSAITGLGSHRGVGRIGGMERAKANKNNINRFYFSLSTLGRIQILSD